MCNDLLTVIFSLLNKKIILAHLLQQHRLINTAEQSVSVWAEDQGLLCSNDWALALPETLTSCCYDDGQ